MKEYFCGVDLPWVAQDHGYLMKLHSERRTIRRPFRLVKGFKHTVPVTLFIRHLINCLLFNLWLPHNHRHPSVFFLNVIAIFLRTCFLILLTKGLVVLSSSSLSTLLLRLTFFENQLKTLQIMPQM